MFLEDQMSSEPTDGFEVIFLDTPDGEVALVSRLGTPDPHQDLLTRHQLYQVRQLTVPTMEDTFINLGFLEQ